MFWMVFNYGPDVVGACIEGDKATRYWNQAKPVEIHLKKEYTYGWAMSLNPMDIQAGVFLVAGMDAGKISNFRFIEGDLDWDTFWKENRK